MTIIKEEDLKSLKVRGFSLIFSIKDRPLRSEQTFRLKERRLAKKNKRYFPFFKACYRKEFICENEFNENPQFFDSFKIRGDNQVPSKSINPETTHNFSRMKDFIDNLWRFNMEILNRPNHN